jgi:hypothetical protein
VWGERGPQGPLLVVGGWGSGRDEGGQQSCIVTGKLKFRSSILSFN